MSSVTGVITHPGKHSDKAQSVLVPSRILFIGRIENLIFWDDRERNASYGKLFSLSPENKIYIFAFSFQLQLDYLSHEL